MLFHQQSLPRSRAAITISGNQAIVERLDREPTGEFYFQIHLDYVGDQDPDADEEVDVDYDIEFRDGGPHYAARMTGLYASPE